MLINLKPSCDPVLSMRKSKLFVGAQVPPRLKLDIEGALKTGKYLNESDFIRTALRALLETIEVEAE